MEALEQPKLIITCRAGSEDICIHEICNVLFAKDPSVSAIKTKYRGLVLVYTKLDVNRAYTAVVHREYGFVENIIPVHCVLEHTASRENLVECLTRLKLPASVKLKVRSRGTRSLSSELFRQLSNILWELGVQHTPASSTCLYAEVLESKLYIGVGTCHPVFKFAN